MSIRENRVHRLRVATPSTPLTPSRFRSGWLALELLREDHEALLASFEQPMSEPSAIIAARCHLASAETTWRSADALFHLQEALALLDELSAGGDARVAALAKNLALTYAHKICAMVSGLLSRDAAVPEPELEHLLRVLLAFDDIDIDPPPVARTLKLTLARRLIDRYYEGHSAAAKQHAMEELLRIAGEKKR